MYHGAVLPWALWWGQRALRFCHGASQLKVLGDEGSANPGRCGGGGGGRGVYQAWPSDSSGPSSGSFSHISPITWEHPCSVDTSFTLPTQIACEWLPESSFRLVPSILLHSPLFGDDTVFLFHLLIALKV